MSVYSEPVRSDLIIPKRRSMKSKQRQVGTNTTVIPMVREWMLTCVKHHWYFYEVQSQLHIAFCNKDDAMMYKLAWH